MFESAFFRFRRRRFSLVGMTLIVVLLGLCQSAMGSDSDKATAKAHYEKATRHYEIREFDRALLEYKAAYLAQPDTAFLFNIGQCYRKLGQDQEALNFFQLYLKKASPDDPNRHQVEARIRDIEAEAKLKADAAQAAPRPSSSSPVLNPPPGPTVAPMSPEAATALSATPTSVEQSSPVSAVPQMSSSGGGLRVAGIACGAAGLASVGVAIYYYARARSLSDRVTTAQNPTAADDQAGRDAETMQWVFYSVGAGALASGTLLYLLGWSSANANNRLTGITPTVGPRWAGISAQGAF
jgi:tetratricopeptide (TPR) repeat protein